MSSFMTGWRLADVLTAAIQLLTPTLRRRMDPLRS